MGPVVLAGTLPRSRGNSDGARRKVEAVLRLLRGEDLETLSVAAHERERFLVRAGGRGAL